MPSNRGPILAAVAGLALVLGGGLAGHLIGSRNTPKPPAPAPIPTPTPTPPTPTPDPLADAARLYAGAGEVARAQAVAWRTEAAAIESGTPVPEAQKAGQAAAKSAREAAFDRVVGPQVQAILPDAADLKDPASKAKLVAALRRMADAVDPPRAEPVRGPPAVEEAPQRLFGWSDDAGRPEVAKTLPTLAEAAPHLIVGADEDPDSVFLYKALPEVLGDFPAYIAQQIGDCTSFGTGHALDTEQAVQIAITGGDRSQWREVSTEALYGAGREIAGMLGRGDGCYGAALAKAVTQVGAVSREQVGPYSGKRAKEWGRTGIPAEIRTKAAEHKAGGAAQVSTAQEARKALQNGYPLIICSDVGFEGRRDSRGVIRARGSWPHCMMINAYRKAPDGTTEFCVNQSWGPTMPSGPLSDGQPPYSFWIVQKDAERVLSAGDSYAISGFGPFIKRTLPERWTWSGFAKPAPRAEAPRPRPRKAA